MVTTAKAEKNRGGERTQVSQEVGEAKEGEGGEEESGEEERDGVEEESSSRGDCSTVNNVYLGVVDMITDVFTLWR